MAVTKLRISEASLRYADHCRARKLADSTIRSRVAGLARMRQVIGDLLLDSISGEHVDRVFNHYSWEPTTRNKRIGEYRSFFAWAKGCRYMSQQANPMFGWRQKTPPMKRQLRIPFAEWSRLFDACQHPQERIVIATGLYLFLRSSEQQALRVGCVDLQSNLIDVWRPKTQVWQTLPIPSELAVELRSWLTYLSERYELRDDHHLICSRNKDMRHDPKTHLWIPGSGTLNLERPVYKPNLIVQRVLRRAGYDFDKGIGEHTLRRSGARALFDSLVGEGYDGALKTVQALLGHKFSNVTEIYLGIDVEQRRVLDKFAGRLMFPAAASATIVPILEGKRG